MGYALPILTDVRGNFTNWMFLQTGDGSRVLLVFEQDGSRLDRFIGGYERVHPPEQGRLGFLYVDEPSLIDLVKLIERVHPELFEEAVLIHEEDPSFEALLSAFVEQESVDVVVIR